MKYLLFALLLIGCSKNAENPSTQTDLSYYHVNGLLNIKSASASWATINNKRVAKVELVIDTLAMGYNNNNTIKSVYCDSLQLLWQSAIRITGVKGLQTGTVVLYDTAMLYSNGANTNFTYRIRVFDWFGIATVLPEIILKP